MARSASLSRLPRCSVTVLNRHVQRRLEQMPSSQTTVEETSRGLRRVRRLKVREGKQWFARNLQSRPTETSKTIHDHSDPGDRPKPPVPRLAHVSAPIR